MGSCLRRISENAAATSPTAMIMAPKRRLGASWRKTRNTWSAVIPEVGTYMGEDVKSFPILRRKPGDPEGTVRRGSLDYQRKPDPAFCTAAQFPGRYADLRLRVSRASLRDFVCDACASILEPAEPRRLHRLGRDRHCDGYLPLFPRILPAAAAAPDPRYSVLENSQRSDGNGGSQRPGGGALHHDRSSHRAGLLLLPHGGVGVETRGQEQSMGESGGRVHAPAVFSRRQYRPSAGRSARRRTRLTPRFPGGIQHFVLLEKRLSHERRQLSGAPRRGHQQQDQD